jgi:hypothetical protein
MAADRVHQSLLSPIVQLGSIYVEPTLLLDPGNDLRLEPGRSDADTADNES